MSFWYRARAWWACLSILFNQTVHFGNAPYPYTFSETCYLRRHLLRYAICRAIIDSVFKLFGEKDHCELSHYVGRSFRAKEQI
jgi:hypothetical protein